KATVARVCAAYVSPRRTANQPIAPHMRAATAPARKALRMKGYRRRTSTSWTRFHDRSAPAATRRGAASMSMEGRGLRLADHHQPAARGAHDLDRRAVEPGQLLGG